MTRQEAKERVARGAALLDERNPGWAQRLEHQSIEMASCFRCVLGRLYSEYTLGRYKLRICGAQMQEHGFYAESMEPDDYKKLHDCWIEAIAERVTPALVIDAPVVEWQHREDVTA